MSMSRLREREKPYMVNISHVANISTQHWDSTLFRNAYCKQGKCIFCFLYYYTSSSLWHQLVQYDFYRQALNIVVLSLLLYNSEQFQIPIEVLVLYSGTQIPLISLLQKVENISSSSLESIKDNVAVVRGANITIKVFDLDSWGRDRETSSAVSVLIQTVFTKDQCLKNFTIVGPSNSDSAYAVARLIKRSGVSVRHVHTAPLPGLLWSNMPIGLP